MYCGDIRSIPADAGEPSFPPCAKSTLICPSALGSGKLGTSCERMQSTYAKAASYLAVVCSAGPAAGEDDDGVPVVVGPRLATADDRVRSSWDRGWRHRTTVSRCTPRWAVRRRRGRARLARVSASALGEPPRRCFHCSISVVKQRGNTCMRRSEVMPRCACRGKLGASRPAMRALSERWRVAYRRTLPTAEAALQGVVTRCHGRGHVPISGCAAGTCTRPPPP